jgi:hypothetical protein
MIISHRHRFIFIKTHKTAGTSIEIALSEFCGPSDVITPISPEDEALRKELGYPGPQNILIPFKRYSKMDLLGAVRNGNRLSFFNHAPAKFVRQHIDENTWRTYFKFCFERNPWDKVISKYYFKFRTKPRPAMSDFLASPVANSIPGYDMYTDQSEVLVDRVYRYEQLVDSLADAYCRVGIQGAPRLPHAKGAFREDRSHYRDVLSVHEGATIASVYAREIRLMGYKW